MKWRSRFGWMANWAIIWFQLGLSLQRRALAFKLLMGPLPNGLSWEFLVLWVGYHLMAMKVRVLGLLLTLWSKPRRVGISLGLFPFLLTDLKGIPDARSNKRMESWGIFHESRAGTPYLQSTQLWYKAFRGPFFSFCLFRAAPVANGSSQAGVEVELQLLAYTTATVTPDLSRIWDLHHSSWQCRILNPLSGARDRTRMVPSRMH